jgi:hypothetical protein
VSINSLYDSDVGDATLSEGMIATTFGPEGKLDDGRKGKAEARVATCRRFEDV